MSKKLVKWSKPVGDPWRQQTRDSKCGRYRIIKRMVAGARNGSWVPSYEIEIFPVETDKEPEGYKFDCGSLGDAKESAEEDARDRIENPENY